MNHVRGACALFVLVGIVRTALAQESAADTDSQSQSKQLQQQEQAEQNQAEESKLSLEGAITFPTAYVFRGYVIDDSHFLVQPEFTISYAINVGGLSLTPHIGAWANLTDAPSPGQPQWFNEIDAIAGVDVELPEKFTLGLVYTYYNSPADFFDDVHEIGMTLSHDDLLQPSVGVYRELDNRAGGENTYIELGLTPGFDVPQISALHLDFPILLGLTPDKYYTHENGNSEVVGYASVGALATWSFSDHWGIFAGVDYVQLLADSARASNKGDDHQWVGKAGVQFSF